jgi:glyoxylase-like metal-dependent hydrolase (beta-lactamase superfamily II)
MAKPNRERFFPFIDPARLEPSINPPVRATAEMPSAARNAGLRSATRKDTMIFSQLFHTSSSSYTYILAERRGGEALIIDPVLEHVPRYLALIEQLDLQLVMAIDTHTHADHVTGTGQLRMETDCLTAMGEQSKAECVSLSFRDGETIKAGKVRLTALHTPGHTDDSYSFLMPDRVFTGDTLLIGATGRTDFQNGDAGAQYDSLFGRLLTLPDETWVYPAHDYDGRVCSTIRKEKKLNPRLQVDSRQAYIAQMEALELDPPKMMQAALPANRQCGLDPQAHARSVRSDAA